MSFSLRRICCLLLPILLTVAPAAAQQSGEAHPSRVTGRVVAADTNEPLVGATIALWRMPDSTLVAGAVTAEGGSFALETSATGALTARVSFVGYERTELSVELSEGEETRDLGTLSLTPRTESMENVEVTGERVAMEVQADRNVYNVSEQLTSAGGTARNVLEDLPSIGIDLDGSISLRGNENVALHLNGKPTSRTGEALISFLQSLSADAVERVEVIPNPSAKHEPDGMAGIINIVLKKNRSAGWNGGVTAGIDSDGTNSSHNASGNLGYQSGPWSLFATYGFNRNAHGSSGQRMRENFRQDPTNLLDQSSSETHAHPSHSLNTELKYETDSGTSLSFESTLDTRRDRIDGRANYVEQIGGTLQDRYTRSFDRERTDYGLDGRLVFEHAFTPDEHTLVVEARYGSDWEDAVGTYRQRALASDGAPDSIRSRERDDLSEERRGRSIQLDYTRPLGPFDLETGYKGTLRRLDSDERFELFDADSDGYRTERVNAFTFDEQTHAAYGILSTDLGSFTLQGGLRAEQALTTFDLETTGDAYDNNYFSLFPSGFVLYKPSEVRQVRLSYSKRINRPNLWQINPFDSNRDPLFRRRGNPFLDPEYIHAFELTLTQHWSQLTVTVSPYFRHTVNEIERRETIDEDGVTTLTFENFASSNSYGAEATASLNLGGWLRGNVTANAYRAVTDASNVDTDLSNDALAATVQASLTFALAQRLDLQVNQRYFSPIDIAGGRIGARASTGLALKKELFDGRASLSLQGRDVLGTMDFDVERRLDAFAQQMSRTWASQRVGLTFTYNFGQENQQRRGPSGSGGFEGGNEQY